MKKETRKSLQLFGRLLNVGFSVFITILIGVGLGILLDNHFQTNYIKIITIIVFTIIAVVNFFIEILKVK